MSLLRKDAVHKDAKNDAALVCGYSATMIVINLFVACYGWALGLLCISCPQCGGTGYEWDDGFSKDYQLLALLRCR